MDVEPFFMPVAKQVAARIEVDDSLAVDLAAEEIGINPGMIVSTITIKKRDVPPHQNGIIATFSFIDNRSTVEGWSVHYGTLNIDLNSPNAIPDLKDWLIHSCVLKDSFVNFDDLF